ncbi:DUF805 domain-containing protein [Curtobacterium sp. YC1]|uniref:DUF805 domain-containing protein n=1 Tax=Curtobacterium sp. YC1 TaxID=2795488 RepID=UPI0018E551B8|nr:DUF805 domain-containing protein [Curtobacterium sp. YC1]QQD76462.1 DUF805 domain-containing protein [Curtobacterium sp. YC1]
MGDSNTTGFRASVLRQGPVDVTNPVVAWLRFWTQGWRFHGRASRSEFWWVIALEFAVTTALLAWLTTDGTGRWQFFADPFGIVPSPQVALHLLGGDRGWSFGYGSGRSVVPEARDVVVVVGLLVTAVPRWSLLVRRLHDRDHTGLWILLLVFTGPIGWLVVTIMVALSSRPGGARFDRGLFAGRRGSEEPAQQALPSTTGVA